MSVKDKDTIISLLSIKQPRFRVFCLIYNSKPLLIAGGSALALADTDDEEPVRTGSTGRVGNPRRMGPIAPKAPLPLPFLLLLVPVAVADGSRGGGTLRLSKEGGGDFLNNFN